MSTLLRLIGSFVILLALTGCGTSGQSGDQTSPKTIHITIRATSVSPNGKEIDVHPGQPVRLVIKADTPGELHVHSSPEQHIEYGAGTTTKTLKFKQPGTIDIESHALEKLVVQLRVS